MNEKIHTFFLGAADCPDAPVEDRMVDEIDAILGKPDRINLPADTVLFREDEALDRIWILLSGQVSLYKMVEGEEIVFHSRTAGSIIGLLALAHESKAFFSCRAVTDIRVIPIPIKHLDAALQLSESLQATFITVLMKSMVRRNKRLAEVQSEVRLLNRELDAKNHQLVETLDDLRRTQGMLVESEKMATLGQLSAGVAHELNNPVAAIVRAAEFARNDLLKLAEEIPNGDALRDMLRDTFTRTPESTREQRARRRELAAELGDDALAARLVVIGIHTADQYRACMASLEGTAEDKLQKLELHHQLGSSLRNITHCAGRISALVSSLRSYIRADQPDADHISVHQGIDDTLTLFANRLHDVQVEKDYGDLPPIIANAGELNQVWTNLIANALDAMNNRGRLVIRTGRKGTTHIQVHVIDNGPGIPAEYRDRIFELRFTTRKGRVDFGLGLGLSITRNIIGRHGGSIEVASEPGRTEFTVTLPVEGPDHSESSSEEKPL